MTQIATAPDGTSVEAITLSGGGLRATVLSWAATVQSLYVEGHPHSLLLGCPDFRGYLDTFRYHSAIVGPVANRIAAGRLSLNGQAYQLDRNENARTTLHGGAQGFGDRNWRVLERAEDRVRLTIDQPDGLCGFPGALQVEALYQLEDRALRVEITGHALSDSYFNPAFHGYWTLDPGRSILDHQLQIDAETYTPVDAEQIPTGVAPVAGTRFDHRQPRPPAPDLDHNFCLSDRRTDLRPVARLSLGDMTLEVETTEPGLQAYAAGTNSSAPWPEHQGTPIGPHRGLALEPQIWPDAPNQPGFPSARIAAGQTITQVSVFRLR